MADKRKPLILTLDPVDPVPEEAAPVVEAPADIPPAPAGEAAPAPEPVAKPRREPRVRKTAAERAKPEPRPAAPRAEAAPALARWAYPAAITAAILWAGCLTTFVLGYERGGFAFDYAPFRWAIAAGLALLPASLMLVFGYMIRQSARLADESRRTRALADELAAPAALASAHAGGALGLVRDEIARAQTAAEEAGRRMTALHAQLSEETRLVSDAATQAERAASRLGGRLQSERAELGSLSGALDAQLASAAEGAARHVRLAAEASDLAQANLAEAQASLAVQTAGLVAAAGEAGRAVGAVGGDLTREGDRLARITEDLKREQAAWAEAARALLMDEDDAAARLETQRARFAETADDARLGARQLTAASDDGAAALRRLVDEAVAQVNAATDAAHRQANAGAAFAAAQRAALEEETRAALERLAVATEAARASASHSAATLAVEAEAAGEAARLRIEGMAETAFAAAQRADQAFDSRLAAARRAIDAQATLVEDAGVRSAARIEAGVEAVRAALGEAEALAGEVERRYADLAAAARAAPPPPPAAVEPASRAVAGFERLSAAVQPIRPAPPLDIEPPALVVAATPTEAPPLRPRLRLAIDADAADHDLFDPTPAPAPPSGDLAAAPRPAPAAETSEGWSWKDLLTSMDDEPPLDDEALASAMIGEIEAMGVDPGALLPRARIEEIARAVDAGDRSRAREAVRRLAPAAVRRLSRRVLTDKVLRGQADLYRRRYGDLVRDQAALAGGAGSTSTLLGSDPGRAYLLLDAAVGDLH